MLRVKDNKLGLRAEIVLTHVSAKHQETLRIHSIKFLIIICHQIKTRIKLQDL